MNSQTEKKATPKTSIWRLGILILGGVLLATTIARAVVTDDSDMKLNSADGTTQFAVQDSNANKVFTVNSLGGVTISSNTILPGATFYQNGNIRLSGPGNNTAISSTTFLMNATFYANAAPIITSATAVGYMQLQAVTALVMQQMQPTAVGQMYFCSGCKGLICISTGTSAVGQFSAVTSTYTRCW